MRVKIDGGYLLEKAGVKEHVCGHTHDTTACVAVLTKHHDPASHVTLQFPFLTHLLQLQLHLCDSALQQMQNSAHIVQDGCRMDMDLEDDDDDENDQQASDSRKGMYVKYDRKLHGPKRPGQKDPLSVTFLKKYIRIAKIKVRCTPACWYF